MRINPQATAAAAWAAPSTKQKRARCPEARWNTREASGTATWLIPMRTTKNGPIRISEART